MKTESHTSAPPSRPSSLSIDTRSPMAEMEGILSTTTDYSRYMDALSTLRRCSLDTMQGSSFREKAKALVWKYQANGWDEV